MRLICPNCNAQYNVDEALIPEEGRDVQCATCKKTWFQEKSFSETPLKLTTPVAPPPPPTQQTDRSPKTPSGPAGPEAPRKTMGGGTTVPKPPVNDKIDREELRRAVEEEIAIKSGYEDEDEDDLKKPVEDPDEDTELLKSLRDQLAEAGNDEYDSGPATSRRRSVVKAAESAGIPSDELLADRSKKLKPTDISLDFIEEFNETRPRKRRLRGGMLTALILAAILAGVYAFQAQIVAAYPPAAPYLAQYSEAVDKTRGGVENLAAMVKELIANRDAPAADPAPATEPASQ